MQNRCFVHFFQNGSTTVDARQEGRGGVFPRSVNLLQWHRWIHQPVLWEFTLASKANLLYSIYLFIYLFIRSCSLFHSIHFLFVLIRWWTCSMTFTHCLMTSSRNMTCTRYVFRTQKHSFILLSWMWYDVMWCGVGWCGVVWCNVMWCDVMWCLVWCGEWWCVVV